ncbi:MAG TPA: hypothetical protein VEA37_14325, partial [Flavobacterium sp.]|nr:hypothetical protein [Flavobacterium sp.]
MKVLRYPVIAITLFFALGILAASYLAPTPFIITIGVSIAFILFMTCFWQSGKDLIQKPLFAVSTIILAFCTGMLAQTLHHSPNSKLHYSHYTTTSDVPVIEGYITERLKPDE